MLLAVTEREAGLKLDRDVFVATVGGARLSDPATDLAVCLAVASAASTIPMPADVAVIGEVALSGDIRPVSHIAQRVDRGGARRLPPHPRPAGLDGPADRRCRRASRSSSWPTCRRALESLAAHAPARAAAGADLAPDVTDP